MASIHVVAGWTRHFLDFPAGRRLDVVRGAARKMFYFTTIALVFSLPVGLATFIGWTLEGLRKANVARLDHIKGCLAFDVKRRERQAGKVRRAEAKSRNTAPGDHQCLIALRLAKQRLAELQTEVETVRGQIRTERTLDQKHRIEDAEKVAVLHGADFHKVILADAELRYSAWLN